MRLKGRKALITGGGSGIGRAAAILFSAQGAQVSIMGRTSEKLEITAQMVREAGGSCLTLKGDVSIESEAEESVKLAAKEMGGLDILFNNAGVYSCSSAADTGADLWDCIMEINLKGTFLVSKYAVHEMAQSGGGVVINNSSTLGIKPVANTAAYSAAKAAVVSLTRSMALEHAAQGIRVNCICPGVVDTPIHEEMHGSNTSKFLEEMASFHPLGFVGTPEDIACAALFLASQEARWITGAILPVDGGISCS